MSNITLVNDKLTFLTTQSENAVKRYEVFLRPTEKNEFFRFRLLWFKSPNSNRKTPWIERHIHSFWSEVNGKHIINEIVCPTSKHVAENWHGNAYDSCPICNFAGINYAAYRDSNKKDKIAQQNIKNFKYKYDLVIPVYVVSDPVYSTNNGKVRVFRINDKTVGDKFKKLVISKSSVDDVNIFNGNKGLDFLIRMDKVRHVVNEGTDKQYEFTKNEIVQMGFYGKSGKQPYEIPAITPELFDDFPFDDVFGASPTPESLRAYYKKFCLNSDGDEEIDLNEIEDLNSSSNKTTAPEPVAHAAESNKPDDEFEGDVSFDVSEMEEESLAKENSTADDIDVDALLADADLQ